MVMKFDPATSKLRMPGLSGALASVLVALPNGYNPSILIAGHPFAVESANAIDATAAGHASILGGVSRDASNGTIYVRAYPGEYATDSGDTIRKMRAEIAAKDNYPRGAVVHVKFAFNIDPETTLSALGANNRYSIIHQHHQANSRYADGSTVPGSPILAFALLPNGSNLDLQVTTTTSKGLPNPGQFSPVVTQGTVANISKGTDHIIEYWYVDDHGYENGSLKVIVDGVTVCDYTGNTGYEYVDLQANVPYGGQSTQNANSYVKFGAYLGFDSGSAAPTGVFAAYRYKDIHLTYLSQIAFPNATVGQAYTGPTPVVSGEGPFVWSVTAPSGFAGSTSTGVLTGTAASAATGTVTTSVTDATGFVTSRSASLTAVAALTATTTSLGTSATNPTSSDTVTLTATVAPSAATGTVTFKEGATTLGTASVSNGSASISGTFAAGSHSITATYSGDSTYAASTSSALTVTSTQASGSNAATARDGSTITTSDGSPLLLKAA